jgi:hypothetical protein
MVIHMNNEKLYNLMLVMFFVYAMVMTIAVAGIGYGLYGMVQSIIS